MPKIFIICNDSATLYSQRKELIETLHAKGFELAAVCQRVLHADDIERLGCKIIPLATERHSKNPFKDFALINQYKRILKSEKPDVVLTYHIKPNCYAGYVCGRFGIPYLVNVCGLGTPLEEKNPLRPLIVRLYKAGVKKASCVFFQNKKNEKFFDERNMAPGHHHLIPGSGVNVFRFPFIPYPQNENRADVFLFVGRVMRDKGIDELLVAANLIKAEYPKAKFLIVGGFDGRYEKQIEVAQNSEVIEYLGQQKDILPFYEQCSAVVLPSYHEGMANVLLEASSCGRPVLASSIPGCRETFDDGVTGIAFEPKNVDSLVDAIKKFINMPYEKKVAMGKAARKKMEKEFDRQIVVDAYLEEIEKATKKAAF